MAVRPLDAFLRDHVRAPLKEKGFSRKGRDFRLTAPNGDVALINFFSWRLGDREVEFFLDVGILPLTWTEFLNDRFGEADGSIASTLWWTRLNSPFKSLGLWQFDLDDTERMPHFLRELASQADCLRFLIDRQNLVSEVRKTEIQRLRSSREHALASLLVGEGPSHELEETLRVLEAKDSSDELAAWIRTRLSSRSAG